MASNKAFDVITSNMTLSNYPGATVSAYNTARPRNNFSTTPSRNDGLGRSILESCQHPVYIDPSDQPCSHFFQQSGAIDFKSYLRLKKEERLAVIQYHAAVRIQAFWRGFLIRSNWKIVEAAIIKIQSWIRGHSTRKQFRKILEERDAKIQMEKMIQAAIKIQAAWRGYLSRKNKLDFKKYKSIQEKNEALRRSIARINELESALLKSLHGGSGDSISGGSAESHTDTSSKGSSLDPCAELTKTDDRLSMFLNNFFTPSVESFLVEKIPEYVNELSETRISELYAYLANMETDMKQEQELENLVRKMGGTQMLSSQQLLKLEESRRVQKERASRILDLAKLVMMGPLKKKLEMEKQDMMKLGQEDSVDNMFTPMPDRPDLIKPDPIKVEALKDAIRMFRQKGEANEDRDLKRKHVLLRTKACPGVYSDIYTTELTGIEQKLKSLKFWKGSLVSENLAKKEQLAKETRLRRLFAHALKISNKRRTPELEIESEEETIEEEFPLDLYQEYPGEIGPEDYDDEDSDAQDEFVGTADRRGSRSLYVPPPDPRPPPPTPTTTNNGEDFYLQTSDTSGTYD